MAKKLLINFLTLTFLLLLTNPVNGGMPPSIKKRIGIPPFEVLREILKTNNAETRASRSYQDDRTPYLTWLADLDPRLKSNLILPGKYQMLTVQNPGGQLLLSPGPLEYGIYQLHTPVLLITGISDSRHINYYLRGYQDLNNSLQMDLDHLHLALDREAEIDLERESPAEKLLRLVETNVNYQVKQALRLYEERVKEGRLVVIGSIFDTSNLYGKGKNKLTINNINGKKGEKLKDLQLVRQLHPDLRGYVIMED